MKKSSVMTTLKTTFLMIGAALTMLTSCDNFLKNGQDVKNEILDSIAYNNAPSCTVNFSDEGMGTFLVNKKETFKVGYASQVQFEAKIEEYYFIGLEAVNNSDKTPLKDYVKFELAADQTERNTANGIYKYNVTILKADKDILIRPQGLAYPAVSSYMPSENDKTNPVNTPIVINFSMPVDPETIKDNVLFSWNGSNMAEYFEQPVLNAQKNVLTITPKAIELKDFLKTLSVIDINIFLTPRISVKKEGCILPLRQDSNSNFTIRFNNEIEQDPPQEIDFFVTGYEISLDTAEQFEGGKFATGDFNVSSDRINGGFRIKENRCGNFVYIYGNYYDKDSGVQSVIVKDKRTSERFNNNAAVNEEEFETIYTKDSDNVEFISDGTGKTVFCIKHEIVSLEGAVSMSVTVTDSCNNPAETKQFIAIKMSSVNLRNFSVYNMSSDDFSYEQYKEEVNILKVKKNLDAYIYGNIQTKITNFTLFCEYKDRDGIIKKQQFYSENTEAEEWKCILDVDITNELPFNIIIVDEFGNEQIQECSFPGSVSIESITEQPDREDGRYKVLFRNKVCVFEMDPNDNSLKKVETFVIIGPYTYYAFCDPNLKYYVIGASNNLMLETYDFVINNLEVMPPVEVTNVSVTKGDKIGYCNVTVSIADDSWQKYDNIYIQCAANGVNLERRLERNTFSGFFSVSLSGNSIRIRVCGSKYSMPMTDEKIILIDNVDIKALDNVPPEFSVIGQKTAVTYKDADYFVLNVNDTYNSELLNEVLYGRIEFDEGLNYADYFEMDSDNPEVIAKGLDFKIPIWYLEENYSKKNQITLSDIYDESEIVNFYYETEDNVGNYKEGNETITLKTLFSFMPYNYEGGTTCSIKSRYVSKKMTDRLNLNVYVAKFNTTSNEWDLVPESTISGSEAVYNSTNNFYYLSSVSLPENSFTKILVQREAAKGGEFADALYLYTGAKADWNSGKYDYVIANGSSKESVIVSSDAPAFVHVLATSKSYDECKDWSIAHWEHNRRHFGDKYIDFSTDSKAQIYKIPMDEIYDEDWNCYVVIAHFADGTTAMSEVMQR